MRSSALYVVTVLAALCAILFDPLLAQAARTAPSSQAATAASRSAAPPNAFVSRIVGGSQTTIEKYPMLGQVLRHYPEWNVWALSCASTILSPRHVLSAAHCFERTNPNVIRIRTDSSMATGGGVTHGISSIIMHSGYNNPPRDNDIAILVLNTAIRLGATAMIGVLPAQGYNVPDNSSVFHAGWGALYEGGAGSTHLMEVQVYTINLEVCRARYSRLQAETNYYYGLTNNMICAGILDVGGRDACQGDSGGPMLYGSTVVGITSWGEGCANATYPGVSCRVSSYINWINQTMTRYPGSGTSRSAEATLGALLLGAALSLLAHRH